jgi:hypothetical protein
MNAVGSTIFLFFSTSSLVSYTLRETQARMLKFTYLLQHHIQHNLPIAGIIFTHVTESLLFVPMMVGLLFFLREFFRDQIIAFTVLSLVWCVEVFAIISLRTAIATNFFPRLFCIYLSFYLLYFFHFPFAFNYLALFITVLLTLHAMLYCMNTFEIPALSSGRINDTTTRESHMNQIEAIINETADDDTLRVIHNIHNDENLSTNNNVATTVRFNHQLTSDRIRSPPHHIEEDVKNENINESIDSRFARDNDNIMVRTSEHMRRRKAASELITLRVNSDQN